MSGLKVGFNWIGLPVFSQEMKKEMIRLEGDKLRH